MRSLIIFCACLFTTHLLAQQSLVFLPKKPQPGRLLTFHYNPSGTSMFGEDSIEAIAYLLTNNNVPNAQDITLKKANGQFTGVIRTTDTTKAVFVTFAKDHKRDNNSGKGYYTLMYDNNGFAVLGAKLIAAYAFLVTGSLWGLERNIELANQMMKDEFNHPKAINKFKRDYLSMLARSHADEDKILLKKSLDQIVKQSNPSEEDLGLAEMYYERTFKDSVKTLMVKQLLEAKYPGGNWMKTDLLISFYKESDLLKKEMINNRLVSTYPAKSQSEQDAYDNLATILASSFASSGNIPKTEEYLQKIQGDYNKAQAFNSVAWKLSGEGIDKKPIDSVKGKEISAQSIEQIKALMKNLKDRPSYLTPKQWQQSLKDSYGAFQDTYATFLYQSKDYAGAYEHEKEAADASPSVYAYAILTDLTEKIKGRDSAQKELEKYAMIGQMNSKMNDQLKSIYLSNHSESQWESYINGLEKAFKEKNQKALIAQMINVPANNFVLKDMKGKMVELSQLKGKTVVVDFWATWCGPCKASFPGMQKTVTKYKGDSNVVFLFIDTWEKDKNFEKLVEDFIQKNKYDFTVLYDETLKNSDEYRVVSNYKVDGIPTKFVIDQAGNIRFKVVGFGGEDDALVEELSNMIELSKN